ncbi:hypothetical protein [Serratia symbiotica]|uniref:Uncharacterized protein n=1 Tax=Serratia symbiotica TaxID=138074 RepID=A0A068Z2V7_9GAMM|nr:hypothetical protein [Serratia symbiotica]MBF1994357.1 hypothetical protein [Serratia symbiotica]MBQ0954823.1 hypothetical protein [Serratia symbiotica]QLH63835.1 hypothetical protein SYMBAF_14060 [Serratia symbiotica]QTP14276.1 hypothetical protein GPZ83_0013140 [Serratia symbiotica]CDS55478.1 exported hypothetical protein [Serratia symbiotica]
MNNHYFYTLPPWAIKSSLLLLILTLPVLLGIHAQWQQQRELRVQLVGEEQQLLAHQQAAEALRLRQKTHTHQQQQSPPRLVGLEILAKAWRNDVALLSLDLDAHSQRMRIELASHSLGALLDFVARLQEAPAKVWLENHTRNPSLIPPWQISGTLHVEYNHAS